MDFFSGTEQASLKIGSQKIKNILIYAYLHALSPMALRQLAIGWWMASVLWACVLATEPDAGQKTGIILNEPLSDYCRFLSASGWDIKVRPHEILEKTENVESIVSFTVKRTFPLKQDARGKLFPRFRIDILVFHDKDKVPLSDGKAFQRFARASAVSSAFPAQRYHFKTSSLGSMGYFLPHVWECGYAIHDAFRKGRQVIVIYTDAAAFADLLPSFLVDMMAIYTAPTREKRQEIIAGLMNSLGH